MHDHRVIPCVSGLVFSVCFHTEAWHFGFSRFYHHPVVAQQTALAYCRAVSCSRLKRTCYSCHGFRAGKQLAASCLH